MFGLSAFSSWLIVLAVVVVISLFSRYLQRDLESPYKEKVGLRHTCYMYVIGVSFFYFTLPSFFTYVPPPGEIETLEQAISMIEKQGSKLGQLSEELHFLKASVICFAGMLFLLSLMLRYYSRELPDDEIELEDKDEIISIFEDAKK